MSWNYAKLSETVSKCGGPEKFVSSTIAKGYKSGYQNGYRDGSRKGAITGIVSLAVSGIILLYEEGPKIQKLAKNWFEKENIGKEKNKE